MKSGRDETARGSILGSSPRPDREHRKPQPTTCYTVVCVKTAVEISEESRHIGSYRSGHEPGNTDPNPDPSSPLDTNRDSGVWESDRHLPPCLRSEVPAPVSCLTRLPRPSCPLMRSPRHQDSGHCNQSVFFRSQLNRFPSDPPALPITPAVQLASRCSSRSSGRGRRSSDREW